MGDVSDHYPSFWRYMAPMEITDKDTEIGGCVRYVRLAEKRAFDNATDSSGNNEKEKDRKRSTSGSGGALSEVERGRLLLKLLLKRSTAVIFRNLL